MYMNRIAFYISLLFIAVLVKQGSGSTSGAGVEEQTSTHMAVETPELHTVAQACPQIQPWHGEKQATAGGMLDFMSSVWRCNLMGQSPVAMSNGTYFT